MPSISQTKALKGGARRVSPGDNQFTKQPICPARLAFPPIAADRTTLNSGKLGCL